MATSRIDPNNRRRSPSFPSLGLEQAVTAVRKIYDEDRQVATLRETAAKHIGYAGNNGSAARTLASLAHYGLIEEAGLGKVRVTEVAKALLHPKDVHETLSLLKQSVERPKVFNHLISRYGLNQMPSQETLKNELIREMHFNKEAADEVLRALKLSIAYVRSAEVDMAEGLVEPKDSFASPDENEDNDEGAKPYAVGRKANVLQSNVDDEQWIDGPLSNRTKAELHIHGPLGTKEIERLKAWLDNIVKPWAAFRVIELEEAEDRTSLEQA